LLAVVPEPITSLTQSIWTAAAIGAVLRGKSPLIAMALPLQNPAAATDLISFPKALPGCRMRRELRLPQWWMLVVAILAILSNQGSLLGMERGAQPQASA
jgi:hypothetical protein